MAGSLQMEIRRDMSELANRNEHLKKGEQDRTRIAKARILEALEKSMGIVTTSCKAVGIGRTQFYKWKEDDEEFRRKVGEVMNLRLDFLENELLSRSKRRSQDQTL